MDGITAPPVQLPSAAWRTMPPGATRLPTGAVISYVKQRPETCGKRPLAPGMADTPFSRNASISAPLTEVVETTFPNGSTASTWPRVIRNGGGVKLGQKPSPPPAGGHVRSARRPPEFVIAKSVAEVNRIASVTALPIFDSQSRPSA